MKSTTPKNSIEDIIERRDRPLSNKTEFRVWIQEVLENSDNSMFEISERRLSIQKIPSEFSLMPSGKPLVENRGINQKSISDAEELILGLVLADFKNRKRIEPETIKVINSELSKILALNLRRNPVTEFGMLMKELHDPFAFAKDFTQRFIDGLSALSEKDLKTDIRGMSFFDMIKNQFKNIPTELKLYQANIIVASSESLVDFYNAEARNNGEHDLADKWARENVYSVVAMPEGEWFAVSLDSPEQGVNIKNYKTPCLCFDKKNKTFSIKESSMMIEVGNQEPYQGIPPMEQDEDCSVDRTIKP